MKAIYQVEGTVEKDAAGSVTRLEWVDVTKEEADRAWEEFGLLVRVVYVPEDGDDEPCDLSPWSWEDAKKFVKGRGISFPEEAAYKAVKKVCEDFEQCLQNHITGK